MTSRSEAPIRQAPIPTGRAVGQSIRAASTLRSAPPNLEQWLGRLAVQHRSVDLTVVRAVKQVERVGWRSKDLVTERLVDPADAPMSPAGRAARLAPRSRGGMSNRSRPRLRQLRGDELARASGSIRGVFAAGSGTSATADFRMMGRSGRNTGSETHQLAPVQTKASLA